MMKDGRKNTNKRKQKQKRMSKAHPFSITLQIYEIKMT